MKLLTRETILDCSKSWKDCFEYIFPKSDDGSLNPYNTDRVNEFINNAYPNNSLAKNMDMATLLILLKYRNCDITLPYYENTGVKKTKSNVEKVSNKTHGKILQLSCNQDTFKFSIMIADEKYKEEKLSGTFDFAPRNYSVTDHTGKFNDAWMNFSFEITPKEREYFKNNIDKNGFICPQKFVNDQLAQAFYSDYYRNLKLLVLRLVAERKYLNDLKKKYLPMCKVLSENQYELDVETKIENKDQFESIKVICFESRLSVEPEFEFKYVDTEKLTPNEIVDICDEQLKGLLVATSEIKFICRLIELAFSNVNSYKEDLKPSDFVTYNRHDCKWNETKIKLPKGRIEWFELMFSDYSILCRYHQKSVKQKIKGNTQNE